MLLLLQWHALIAASPLATGNHEFDIRIGSAERYYLGHLPPQASHGKPLPVLLAFHGGGGTPDEMQKDYRLDALADSEGFIVVYPAGTGRRRRKILTWNARTCCGYAMVNNADDVGFTRAIIDDLASRTSIDRKRVYACGHSNGAMMCDRLAREASDLVAAVVEVCGASLDTTVTPSRSVPVLHIHSVDDPRAAYNGGYGPKYLIGATDASYHANVDELMAWWVRQNGCSRNPKIGTIITWRSSRRAKPHTAQRITWTGGRNGSEVVLIRLTGAGHGWPGQKPKLPEFIMGPYTNVIDANVELWNFCRRFTR